METDREGNQFPWREALIYSLPALVAGLIARVILTWQMPYGIVLQDAFDFLETTDVFLRKGEFVIQGKKTFLVPALYLLPFLIHVKALVFIPAVQHLVGLGSVYLVGVLCRAWFRCWRVLIVPVTLLVSLNPHVVWYEHSLMAESVYLATTLLLAVAGTVYCFRPTWVRFCGLCLAAILQAGARPEAKFFLGAGLIWIVLVHWRSLPAIAIRCGVFAALTAGLWVVTKTSQSGLLLLTAMLPMFDGELRCDPDLAKNLMPVREQLGQRAQVRPIYPSAEFRKLVSHAVRKTMAERSGGDVGSIKREEFEKVCARAGKEIAIKNVARLPAYGVGKYRFALQGVMSFSMDEAYLVGRQIKAYSDVEEVTARLGERMFGLDPAKGAEAFVRAQYDPSAAEWFLRWQEMWKETSLAIRLPDSVYASGVSDTGLPLYFLLGVAGMIAALFRAGVVRAFHLGWVPVMVGMFYLIIVVASPRTRFAFVFEPFFALYGAVVADVVAGCGAWLRGRVRR